LESARVKVFGFFRRAEPQSDKSTKKDGEIPRDKDQMGDAVNKKKGPVIFSIDRASKLYYKLWKLLEIKFDAGTDPPSRSIHMVKVIQTFDVVYTQNFKDVGQTDTGFHIRFRAEGI